jgi:hypothetical protein
VAVVPQLWFGNRGPGAFLEETTMELRPPDDSIRHVAQRNDHSWPVALPLLANKRTFPKCRSTQIREWVTVTLGTCNSGGRGHHFGR